MSGKFKIIKGTSQIVEDTLNDLTKDNFVKVLSTTMDNGEIVVTTYLKPRVNEKG